MDETELIDIRNSLVNDRGVTHGIKNNRLSPYQKQQQIWSDYVIHRADELKVETESLGKNFKYMSGSTIRLYVQNKYFPVKMPFVNKEVIESIKKSTTATKYKEMFLSELDRLGLRKEMDIKYQSNLVSVDDFLENCYIDNQTKSCLSLYDDISNASTWVDNKVDTYILSTCTTR